MAILQLTTEKENTLSFDFLEEKIRQVKLVCERNGEELTVIVEDEGVGIDDVEQAMQPFYTSKPELERSGMGFSFMEAFMDKLLVESRKGKGTRIILTKYIAEGCEE